MKIILSRKGFDSGSGGFASPVLPDGTMVSLPIPEPGGPARGGTAYRDVRTPYGSAATIVRDLSSFAPPTYAHLDPDLDPAARERPAHWRASFGQSGAAAGHLRNQGVGPGDLFLFFGLFRHTTVRDGALAFDPAFGAFHAIFGWLLVSEVLYPSEQPTPSWAAEHPHVRAPERVNNTLYVAAQTSGAGLLDYDRRRRLSCPEGPLSTWRLPEILDPASCGVAPSYHTDPARWSRVDGSMMLRTVGRGQEFVIPDSRAWQSWAESVMS